MIRSNKKLEINKPNSTFGQITIVLYAETTKKTFILTEETGQEYLIITAQTFYYDELTGNKVVDKLIDFGLTEEEIDIYFEKFSSDKIKFRDIFNNMIDYLLKDLIVKRYEGYLDSADLEIFERTKR